jgi:glycosyltransferase involved in cell wall biosynthesis
MIHTNPTNNAGTNLLKLVDDLYKEYNILFSNSVVENTTLCQMYNTADVTINISSNEGFGLSTAESLSCGTPVIVNDTGGLSEQVDDNNTWGIKIKPCYTNLIGSISSPYVNESLCSREDISDAIFAIYSKTSDERNTMGIAGREYIQKNYNINQMCNNLYEGLNDTMSKFIPKEAFSFTKII